MRPRSSPRARRLGAFVAVELLALTVAGPAFAQSQLELTWEAPAGCPQAATVRERVRELAGKALSSAGRLRAEGRVVRVGERFRLTLSLRDAGATRERSMESDSCADLAGAAAVALGLLLKNETKTSSSPDGAAADGSSGDGTSPHGSSNASASAGDAAGEKNASNDPGATKPTKPGAAKDENRDGKDDDDTNDPAPSRDETSPGSARRWNVLLRAPLLALSTVALPASLGLGAGVGFRYDEWRAVLVGRILKDRTLWSPDFPEVGVRVGRATAELWACRGFRSHRLEVAPCLVAGIDHVSVRGVGPDVVPGSRRAAIVVLGGGGTVHLHLFDWVAALGSIGLTTDAPRPRFRIQGVGEVNHMGPLEVSATLGSEWIF